MWQRVQTLYIALSTALMASLFFCEKSAGISYISYVPYLVLLIVITLLDLLALGSYKFRIFQFRTMILSALITLGLAGWLLVDYILTDSVTPFRWTAIFPIAAIILDWMAARNIWADELIVRSASRLRSAKRKQMTKQH